MVIFNASVTAAGTETVDHHTVPYLLRVPDPYQSNEFQPEKPDTNTLPASLITIEDGAFEGTSLSNVSLSEEVKDIGDHAFADIEALRLMFVSDTVETIHQNAFAESNSVTIQTATGTYAKHWAQRQGVPYVIVPFFIPAAEKTQTEFLLLLTRGRQITVRRAGRCFAEKKESQTGRPAEEIKLPRFNGNASEIIQSRYFP